jgi:hypothetical protein
MAELTLVLRIGAEKRAFTLASDRPAITIGRSPDVELPLKAQLLSRRHCELRLGEKGLELKDLGSANGTFLNGQRVDSAGVETGDIIQVGDVELRVEFDHGGTWVASAAEAGDLRCKRCGRLLSMSTVGDGHTFEWGEEVLCPSCAEGSAVDSSSSRRLAQLLAADGYTVLSQISPHATISPVVKARRPGLDDLVAIKALVVGPSLPEKKIERFRAEARAMAQIKHPNVVHVYDVKHRPELFYIVMEFIDGDTLLSRIERQGKFTVEKALPIALAVGRALEAAANQGIVHRNVKPANILISRAGTPKLIDFGLAKGVATPGPGVTSEEETLGTIRYMSPEQVKDARAADHRSDVYSLGATLFHALTGKLPYPSHSELDLLKGVVTGKLPTFSPTTEESLPKAVTSLIARCLKPRPTDRPEPDELCDELAAILVDGPGRAPENSATRATTTRRKSASALAVSTGRWRSLSAPGTIAGAFVGEQLAELAQLLGMTAKTGVLQVRTGGTEFGVLSIRDGKVVVARTASGGVGESATVEILGVTQGDFEFRPGLPRDVKPEHELAIAPLLLEAFRRRDEAEARRT